MAGVAIFTLFPSSACFGVSTRDCNIQDVYRYSCDGMRTERFSRLAKFIRNPGGTKITGPGLLNWSLNWSRFPGELGPAVKTLGPTVYPSRLHAVYICWRRIFALYTGRRMHHSAYATHIWLVVDILLARSQHSPRLPQSVLILQVHSQAPCTPTHFVPKIIVAGSFLGFWYTCPDIIW